MDMKSVFLALPPFLVLLPSAISCYYTMKNQLRYTLPKTVLVCLAVILPYSILAALLCTTFSIDENVVFLPSLIVLFFVFRYTVTACLPKCVPIYVGVCAAQSFRA